MDGGVGVYTSGGKLAGPEGWWCRARVPTLSAAPPFFPLP